MTKATRDTTKLNFITDQGSTRATVRCACRALRFDDAFFGPAFFGPAFFGPLHGGAFGSSSGVVSPAPGPVTPGAPEAIAFLEFVPALRKFRAGDDGELGGGSGISQANAAGETVGVWGGEEPDDAGPI